MLASAVPDRASEGSIRSRFRKDALALELMKEQPITTPYPHHALRLLHTHHTDTPPAPLPTITHTHTHTHTHQQPPIPPYPLHHNEHYTPPHCTTCGACACLKEHAVQPSAFKVSAKVWKRRMAQHSVKQKGGAALANR